MTISSLDELFLHELQDLYDAEHQLLEALPRMAKAATEPELKAAFEKHLLETRKQITRLKEVFAECEEKPERETCDGMKGLLEEGEKIMDEAEEPSVRDAGLIAAAQKVEHYEMATYGTLVTWARMAGLETAVALLEQSLEEEKAADEKLTEIAETGVNASADTEGEEDEDESEAVVRSPSRSATAGRPRSGEPARSRRAKK